jgi:pyruvate/2-oxoglutarate dehydrogenase complex dihydrolipoamide dehydrogenase (E3) component
MGVLGYVGGIVGGGVLALLIDHVFERFGRERLIVKLVSRFLHRPRTDEMIIDELGRDPFLGREYARPVSVKPHRKRSEAAA